jgi:hypothetical protein
VKIGDACSVEIQCQLAFGADAACDFSGAEAETGTCQCKADSHFADRKCHKTSCKWNLTPAAGGIKLTSMLFMEIKLLAKMSVMERSHSLLLFVDPPKNVKGAFFGVI